MSIILASVEDRIAIMEARATDGQGYTNKSKKVKLIFYANRSTAQTCKPGQTVHPKAGYGRRTKVRDATPEEVKQLKAGKWLRTRESGKGPNEKGSKKTRYRPWLTAALHRIEAMDAFNS